MKNFKQISKACVLLAITGAILFCLIEYSCNAGTLVAQPLDLSAMNDSNPARVEQAIEQATIATVIVQSIEGKDDVWTIVCTIPDYPEILCWTYLSPNDVAKIDVGDKITLRGHIKYYNSNDRPSIVIGDAIRGWPWTFWAKLVTNHSKTE